MTVRTRRPPPPRGGDDEVLKSNDRDEGPRGDERRHGCGGRRRRPTIFSGPPPRTAAAAIPPAAADLLLRLRGAVVRAVQRRRLLPALVSAVSLLALAVLAPAIGSRLRERALREYLSERSGFHPRWHPAARAERFPTVEERVRTYMGDWYRVPCREGVVGGDSRKGLVRYGYEGEDEDGPLTVEYFDPSGGAGDGGTTTATELSPRIRPDAVFRLTRSRLDDCALKPRQVFASTYITHGLFRPWNGPPPEYGLEMRRNMRTYCVDARDFGPILDWVAAEEEGEGLNSGGDGAIADKAEYLSKLERWAEALADRGIGAVLKRAALGRLSSDAQGREGAGRRPGRVRRRTARRSGGGSNPPPVIAQFGDHPVPRVRSDGGGGGGGGTADPNVAAAGSEEEMSEEPLPFPLFMKFRPATSAFTSHVDHGSTQRDSLAAKDGAEGGEDDGGDSCVPDPALRPRLVHPPASGRYAPILWRLESHRHYNFLRHVPYWDTPWEEKLDRAVWRGGLTGFRHREMERLSPEERARLTDRDACVWYSERCRLVLSAANSDTVDAGLTFLATQGDYDLPESVDGVPLLKPSLSIPQLLRYKVLVSLQGNDVASGLKWSLFSRSVVLMPPPTVNSWAMEERLVPWVHYVPLGDGEGDGDGDGDGGPSFGVEHVEERVRWVAENDDRARRIAESATLWVWDMFFHEEAAGDEMRAKEEIVRRYRKYFRAEGRTAAEEG